MARGDGERFNFIKIILSVPYVSISGFTKKTAAIPKYEIVCNFLLNQFGFRCIIIVIGRILAVD